MRLRQAITAVFEGLEGSGVDTVLDFGCGSRPYAGLIAARGFKYLACDLDGAPDVIATPGIRLDLDDRSVKGVVSFQVLEHVWDIDWYLNECRRIVQNDGWLVLSTHGTWLYHPHPTDFRRWTRDGLVRELGTHGFDVVHVDALVGPLAWTTQIRALGFRRALAALPFGRVVAWPLMAVLNLRMVLEDAITPAQIVSDNACVYLVICRPHHS